MSEKTADDIEREVVDWWKIEIIVMEPIHEDRRLVSHRAPRTSRF